jgi:hypothetical protein
MADMSRISQSGSDKRQGVNPMADMSQKKAGVVEKVRRMSSLVLGWEEQVPEVVIQKIPDKLSIELWRKVFVKAKGEFDNKKTTEEPKAVMEKIYNFANIQQPPEGFFDTELWKALVQGSNLSGDLSEERKEHNRWCDATINRFIAVEDEVKTQACFDSRVLNFFLDCESSDFDFDTAVNSMALVNALVITIPFGLITSFNKEFWDGLMDQLKECEPGDGIFSELSSRGIKTSDPDRVFDWFYDGFIHDTSTTVFASMCGIILATFYYIFKPGDSAMLTKNGKLRQRLLMLTMFAFTVASITALMLTWIDILESTIRGGNNEMCSKFPSSIRLTNGIGVFSIAISCFLAVIYMY